MEPWEINEKYKRYFSSIDTHNSKRQGLTSFEDTWKTYKWWLREFQMLTGRSEINGLFLWRKFKPREESCDGSIYRRKLTWQLLHHHVQLA